MILDQQIIHIRGQSLLNLGVWLAKKWGQAIAKVFELQRDLAKVREGGGEGLTDDELREEHKKQVAAQTKPLPRKSVIPLCVEYIADEAMQGRMQMRERRLLSLYSNSNEYWTRLPMIWRR